MNAKGERERERERATTVHYSTCLSQDRLLVEDAVEKRNVLDQLVRHHPRHVRVRTFPAHIQPTSPNK